MELTIKGTIIDFLQMMNENEELRREVVQVANKHGFEFDDAMSDEDLDAVAGGTFVQASTDALQADSSTDSLNSTFENFDQKSNQLYNILSTVLKTTKDTQNSVTRNIL